MSRNTYIALLFGAGVVLVLTVRTVVALIRFNKVEHEFASVQRGESRDSVTAKLGKPTFAKCGAGPHRNNCDEEYEYSHPFAPVVPQYLIVSFSADDKVIEAESLASP